MIRPRLKWPLLVLAALLLLLVAAQVLATPLARHYTHRNLRQMEGYAGKVGEVRASLVPPRYTLEELSLIEIPGGRWQEPLLSVRRLDVRVEWRKLLRGSLVANVVADGPRINIVQHAPKSGERKVEKVPDLGEELGKRAPLTVDRLEIRDGAATVVDRTRTPSPAVRLSDVEGRVGNLATRAALAQGEPTTLQLHGRLQRTGEVSVEVEADPWKKGLNFRGRASLEHLAVADLNNLIESTAEMKPVKGTLDVLAEFEAVEGRLNGGVKTFAHELELKPARSDPWNQIKTWLADAAIDLFSTDEGSPKGEQLATTIPIKGNVTDPNAQTWPTILGVVRNAFVRGLDQNFADLPPQTAPEEEDPVEQAADALKPGHGPPSAQPQGQGRTPSKR